MFFRNTSFVASGLLRVVNEVSRLRREANVTFEIRQGEFLAMIGHSGCGKSTLLNNIAGFDQSSIGGVILEGREITKPGLDRMVVFQSFALMTNGPEAELAEIIEVTVPRPRTRAELIDSPDYVRSRNHSLHFLVKGAKESMHSGKGSPVAPSAQINADLQPTA